jgi:hypothetical protein
MLSTGVPPRARVDVELLLAPVLPLLPELLLELEVPLVADPPLELVLPVALLALVLLAVEVCEAAGLLATLVAAVSTPVEPPVSDPPAPHAVKTAQHANTHAFCPRERDIEDLKALEEVAAFRQRLAKATMS